MREKEREMRGTRERQTDEQRPKQRHKDREAGTECVVAEMPWIYRPRW